MRCKHPIMKPYGWYEGYVYLWWCKKTDKAYVGQSMNIERRKESFYYHPDSYAGGSMKAALKQYPPRGDNWEFVLLETLEAPTAQELKKLLEKWEIFWIEQMDSFRNGYNNNIGGDGNNGRHLSEAERAQCGDNRRGKKHKPEAIEKMRKSSTRRHPSPETCEKISKGNKGKKRTPEMRAAESQRMKGHDMTAINAGRKAAIERNGGHGLNYGKKITDEKLLAAMKARQQERGIDTIATAPDGTETKHNTMLDAAKHSKHLVGSVANAIKSGGTTMKGWKFRKALVPPSTP